MISYSSEPLKQWLRNHNFELSNWDVDPLDSMLIYIIKTKCEKYFTLTVDMQNFSYEVRGPEKYSDKIFESGNLVFSKS